MACAQDVAVNVVRFALEKQALAQQEARFQLMQVSGLAVLLIAEMVKRALTSPLSVLPRELPSVDFDGSKCKVEWRKPAISITMCDTTVEMTIEHNIVAMWYGQSKQMVDDLVSAIEQKLAK